MRGNVEELKSYYVDSICYRQYNKQHPPLPIGGAVPPSAPTDQDPCLRGAEKQEQGCGHPRDQWQPAAQTRRPPVFPVSNGQVADVCFTTQT